MRLFCYYALHSVKNQLRKLFKTWLFILFGVCVLVGIVVGLGAAHLERLAQEREEAVLDSVEQSLAPEEEAEETLLWDLEEEPDFFARRQVTREAMLELVCGGAVLGLLLLFLLTADKSGGKIFLPADVSLLFSAPMKPQSVLMFRLMTQLGTTVFFGIYLLLQLPNLTLNLGLSLWAALSFILALTITMAYSMLFQVLLFLLYSAHPGASRALHLSLGALGAVLAALYAAGLGPERDYLGAACRLFNAPGTRFIPVWGWIKGLCLFAVEDNPVGAALCLVLLALCAAALVVLIGRVKADFYEEAMAKSEETAALMERVRAAKAGVILARRREKPRAERVRRDGLRHGSGANVYFFKALYNHFRFARLGVLTKTTVSYLLAGGFVSLIARLVFDTPGLRPAALTLAALCFYRSLGNPLEEDTRMDYFVLIPESLWAKLFWSLLGGTVNCLLDLLPALLCALLLGGGSPAEALAWAVLIASVDFYATSAGAFIALSVPVSAGTNLKQVAQILFLYFGLLPDVGLMAYGLVSAQVLPMAALSVGVNLLLGLVFFGLTPLFLEPKSRRAPGVNRVGPETLRVARRRFSRAGWALLLTLTAGSGAQVAVGVLAQYGSWAAQPWAMWLGTFLPLYAVGVPLGLLVLRKIPALPPARRALGPGRWASLLLPCAFLMYAGNLLGVLVTLLLSQLSHSSVSNPLETFALDDSLPLKILFLVVLAPAIEELLFRRQLIDRLRIYGEGLAAVLSALCFGLFHMNFSQFFYAFALGLLFACVYLKTGRLRYTIALHMCVNFVGSVLGPALLELAGLDTLAQAEVTEMADLAALMTPGLALFLGYALILLLLSLAGLVRFFVELKRLELPRAALELPRGTRLRTAIRNPGMALFLLLCIGLLVFSVFL